MASLHDFTQNAVRANMHTMKTIATIQPRDFFWTTAG